MENVQINIIATCSGIHVPPLALKDGNFRDLRRKKSPPIIDFHRQNQHGAKLAPFVLQYCYYMVDLNFVKY